ncbi:MAG: uracil-DNA glycosylase [Pseudomonadota bacterium]
MGADEVLEDAPINRFEEAAETPPAPVRGPSPAPNANPAPVAALDAAPASTQLAQAAPDLDALRSAMAAFEGCALKHGARNLVFSDGQAAARVMIVGEAPGREEDRIGKPFVGRSGQLLDAMFAAIGLSRGAEDPTQALYITNTLPWRPPQNRDPSSDEIALMKPFLLRHIALADPQVLVLMGNPASKTLLETTTGITRLRGTWAEVMGRPALPMFHPAALLRDPSKKALAWADLLSLKAKLETL